MIAKDTLRQIVIQQKNEVLAIGETVKRDILDEILNWFKDNRVIILTGIRRSGKSTILKQIIQSKDNYCYVNFEDERFIDFRATLSYKLNLNSPLVKKLIGLDMDISKKLMNEEINKQKLKITA